MMKMNPYIWNCSGRKWHGILLLIVLCVVVACEDSTDSRSATSGPGSGETPGGSPGGSGGDSGTLQGNTWVSLDQLSGEADDCNNVLRVVFRDFKSTHPDFERLDPGWGPARGMVSSILGADQKPVYSGKIRGECQLQTNGHCQPCEDWTNEPMWGEWKDGVYTASHTFPQWYTDVPGVNARVEKALVLEDVGGGIYVFDRSDFFPLELNEGLGYEPGLLDDNGVERNFLFTTEIHLNFRYTGGEVFTFRGDDDLWIFVNNRLALDLGGLHMPFEGTINFDAQAAALGIAPGNIYPMDIFHAERHTTQSNFRIETNIACFESVILID